MEDGQAPEAAANRLPEAGELAAHTVACDMARVLFSSMARPDVDAFVHSEPGAAWFRMESAFYGRFRVTVTPEPGE